MTSGKADAGDEQIITDPKLVIEVLSPSTKGCDKRDRFILYRSVPTLREYALIDPAKRQVAVFTLTADSAWLLTDQTTAVELTLSSIGLKLPIDAVFKGVKSEAA